MKWTMSLDQGQYAKREFLSTFSLWKKVQSQEGKDSGLISPADVKCPIIT